MKLFFNGSITIFFDRSRNRWFIDLSFDPYREKRNGGQSSDIAGKSESMGREGTAMAGRKNGLDPR